MRPRRCHSPRVRSWHAAEQAVQLARLCRTPCTLGLMHASTSEALPRAQDLARMLLAARVSCALDSKRAKELLTDSEARALRPGARPSAGP